LIKFLANVGVAGANVTLNLYAEGLTTSSVSLPTPTSPLIDAEIAFHASLPAAHHAKYTDGEADARIAIHAALPDSHHNKVHGAAEHTDITRELFIPAIASHTDGTADEINRRAAVLFTDAADKYLAITFDVPDDFVAFLSFKCKWVSIAVAGNMHWGLKAQYSACSEVVNTHLDEPATGVTATGGNNILNCQEAPTPLTLVNLAVGDNVGVRMERLGTHAADTLEETVKVFGFVFAYTANQ